MFHYYFVDAMLCESDALCNMLPHTSYDGRMREYREADEMYVMGAFKDEIA